MTATERTTTRELIAVHEAGHAVAAAAIGVRVRSVAMVPDGRTHGHCDAPLTGHAQRTCYQVLLAGDVAMELHRAGSMKLLQDLLPKFPPPPLSNDRKLAAVMNDYEQFECIARAGDDALFEATPEQLRAVAIDAVLDVRELLLRNWRAVIAVAVLLLRRGRVDGADVHKIVGRAAMIDWQEREPMPAEACA